MAGRILVLDDEENYAEMLQTLLRDHDYRVDMATRPERAIDQLEEIPYDLVISDYKMPVMDGAGFLKKARELYPNLPFILVSGLMNTPELVKVANMGVTLVMEKPLDTEAFLSYAARFSTPMTPEEKEGLAHESESTGAHEGAGVPLANYPGEPRFFSANSPAAKRFLSDAWAICETGSHMFILGHQGGDGELAVKDLSQWLGNSDKPLTSLPFDDLISGGFASVDSILGLRESSSVIVVRLESVEQIPVAREFIQKELPSIHKTDTLLIAFLCQEDVPTPVFLEAAGETAVVVPPMVERPSDIAEYAGRIVRRAYERLGHSHGGEFTAEAIYAMLAYAWPGNYKEVAEVMARAASACEDGVIRLAALTPDLGIDSTMVPAPADRLRTLMQGAQHHHLRKAFVHSKLDAAKFGKELHLQRPVSSEEELMNIPFLQPDLAEL